MTPLWLYAPQFLAALLSALCFVVGAWCCVLAADYVNHRSTVDGEVGRSATRPASPRAVGSSACAVADQTKGIAPAPRVGVGSPGAADSPNP